MHRQGRSKEDETSKIMKRDATKIINANGVRSRWNRVNEYKKRFVVATAVFKVGSTVDKLSVEPCSPPAVSGDGDQAGGASRWALLICVPKRDIGDIESHRVLLVTKRGPAVTTPVTSRYRGNSLWRWIYFPVALPGLPLESPGPTVGTWYYGSTGIAHLAGRRGEPSSLVNTPPGTRRAVKRPCWERTKEHCAALQVHRRFCKLRAGLQVREAYKKQAEVHHSIIRHGGRGVKAESRAVFPVCMPCDICSDHSPCTVTVRVRDRQKARRGPRWRLSAGSRLRGAAL